MNARLAHGSATPEFDALSDESIHVGGRPLQAGMHATRYWANVVLICISRMDLGYQWDAPIDERQLAIDGWKNYWESVRPQQRPDTAMRFADAPRHIFIFSIMADIDPTN